MAKTKGPDEKEQRILLSEYVDHLLDRAQNGASKSSKKGAARMLSALTLAATFGGLPKMRQVGRILAQAADA